MTETPRQSSAGPGHDVSEIDFRAVVRFGAALIVVAVVVHLLIWLMFDVFAARAASAGVPQYPLAAGQERRLPPEPRLQTHPREDLRDLRTQEDETLSSYGWVDRNAGVVRIPIEAAMKLTLERGLPARPEPAR